MTKLIINLLFVLSLLVLGLTLVFRDKNVLGVVILTQACLLVDIDSVRTRLDRLR